MSDIVFAKRNGKEQAEPIPAAMPVPEQEALAARLTSLSSDDRAWLGGWLKSMDTSLRNIRAAVNFMAAMLLLAIIFGGCTLVMR